MRSTNRLDRLSGFMRTERARTLVDPGSTPATLPAGNDFVKEQEEEELYKLPSY